jgi:hypothetical protein
MTTDEAIAARDGETPDGRRPYPRFDSSFVPRRPVGRRSAPVGARGYNAEADHFIVAGNTPPRSLSLSKPPRRRSISHRFHQVHDRHLAAFHLEADSGIRKPGTISPLRTSSTSCSDPTSASGFSMNRQAHRYGREPLSFVRQRRAAAGGEVRPEPEGLMRICTTPSNSRPAHSISSRRLRTESADHPG